MTSAEPYSSTNWRLAFSIVLGWRSATVVGMGPSLSQPVEFDQLPRDEQASANQSEQDRHTHGDPVETRHVGPTHQVRLSRIIARQSPRHGCLRQDRVRINLGTPGTIESPPCPEKMEAHRDG